MAQIFVNPNPAIVDQEIIITVDSVEPNSPITISASIVHHNILYLGFGHYYADNHGSINLKTAISYGGAYYGLQPMGIFTSMKAMPSKHACPRLLLKGSVEKPLRFRVSAWRNHLTQDEIHQLHLKYILFGTMYPLEDYLEKYLLCRCDVTRTYLSPTVRRIPVKENFEGCIISGVLFMPHGNGPFPGVIDVYGGAGGCIEQRAALLARHGFASLALAYMTFQESDVKKLTSCIDMFYFGKAVSWFSQHRQVKCGGVSIVGVSLGAQIALLASIRNANVTAAVCINSNGVMTVDPDCHNAMVDVVKLCENGQTKFELWHGQLGATVDNHPRIPRPILRHKHDPHTLFMYGSDDPDHKCIDDAIEQLRKSGKKNVYKKEIHGLGHSIEAPYMPLCTSYANGIPNDPTAEVGDAYAHLTDYIPWDWKGNPREHGKGQIEAWDVLLTFLLTHGSRESSKL